MQPIKSVSQDAFEPMRGRTRGIVSGRERSHAKASLNCKEVLSSFLRRKMSISNRDVKGFIFACTGSSIDECLERMLFGTSRQYGAVATTVQKDDLLFLLNLDSDLLYGIFRAKTNGQLKSRT